MAATRRRFNPNMPSVLPQSRDRFVAPKRATYVHPDQGDDPRQDPNAQADVTLTYRIAGVLERHYPGHPWLVEANTKQGIATISIPLFMGQHKYILHVAAMATDPTLRSVARAGGEILERYRIPRQRFSPADFISARDAVPLHRLGRRGHVPT